MRKGDIKSEQTIDISRIQKEFQTMKQVTTLLGELLKIFPGYEFEKLEKQHQSNHYTKYYTGRQQLITLFYAQVGGHDSLRGIQTSLGVHAQKWYHPGLTDIKRSTLSDAMKNRPHQIYEGLFYKRLDKCRSVTPDHKFRFKNPLFSMDATVIALCLSVFPWAEFRQRKGAIKLHYLYDHRGSLPAFMVMTDGKQSDIRVARSQEKLDFHLLVAYIKFQTKYRHSLQELTRMIAAVLMEHRLLIDILSLKEQSLKKLGIRFPNRPYFNRTLLVLIWK